MLSARGFIDKLSGGLIVSDVDPKLLDELSLIEQNLQKLNLPLNQDLNIY